jgi:signal-transduction protein with cAMP-binding, CBS, and nucleotidyltransferase domain
LLNKNPYFKNNKIMIKMKSGYKVMDAMTTKPISVSPEITLQECTRIMDENHVSTVVVQDNEHSIGILSDQDIVRKVIAKGINPLNKKVKEFMETELVVIEPETDIYDALIKMRDLNIRHLPVVKDNKMIGLLTLKDILKIQPQLFELLVEKFEVREENRKPINRIIQNEGICQACGEYSEEIRDINGSLLCPKCAKEQI